MVKFVEVAKMDEIPKGKLKGVKVNGENICLANVDGKIYAISDRCSHMNAPLSMGALQGNKVLCPMHGAFFDVKTGKKLSEPKMGGMEGMADKLPKEFLAHMEQMGKIMAKIETHDQKPYGVKIEDNVVKVKI